MNNKFVFSNTLKILADKNLCFDELSTLTRSFCNKSIECVVQESNTNEIHIGSVDVIPLEDGDEYTVNITTDGVSVLGRDKNSLLRGYMAFLMSVTSERPSNGKSVFGSKCSRIHGKFKVKNRMVHICIFPETTFFMFKKLVRLCAALQYTHVIIEFWGMLKFDCMKELAWPCAFKKEDVKDVIEEAKTLGIIPVPMFNHFGHASQSRGLNGKHVVLDQNPSLAYLFTPEGWAWDIQSETVLNLLSKIRKELYELFGNGEYIHLGCDEAYIYGDGYIEHEIVADFFERITTECVNEGRTPMIWGDMFICKDELSNTSERYECNARSIENAKLIRSKINKKTIIDDWHYNVLEPKWKTSEGFKTEGFLTMCCPWYKKGNIQSAINSVCELKLFGIVQTTWHVLSREMNILYYTAREMGMNIPEIHKFSDPSMAVATVLRKVSFEEYSYEEAGFAANQTGADYRNDG